MNTYMFQMRSLRCALINLSVRVLCLDLQICLAAATNPLLHSCAVWNNVYVICLSFVDRASWSGG